MDIIDAVFGAAIAGGGGGVDAYTKAETDSLLQGKVNQSVVADAYSASATYAVGDLCIYNGALYKCNTAISVAEAWTAAHWTQVTVGGELQNKQNKLPTIVNNKYLHTNSSTGALEWSDVNSSAVFKIAATQDAQENVTLDHTLAEINAAYAAGLYPVVELDSTFDFEGFVLTPVFITNTTWVFCATETEVGNTSSGTFSIEIVCDATDGVSYDFKMFTPDAVLSTESLQPIANAPVATAINQLNQGKVNKPVSESYTITTTSWSALASSAPFTYSATVTATHTIGQDTICKLINDNAVLFATYGFAIGAVSGQSVTIYSVGLPSESVVLEVNYYG